MGQGLNLHRGSRQGVAAAQRTNPLVAPGKEAKFLVNRFPVAVYEPCRGPIFFFWGDETWKNLPIPSRLLEPIQPQALQTRPQTLYQGGNSVLRHESELRPSTASSEIGDLRPLLPGNVSKCSRTSHAGSGQEGGLQSRVPRLHSLDAARKDAGFEVRGGRAWLEPRCVRASSRKDPLRDLQR